MSTKSQDTVWISRETAETALNELRYILDYADDERETGGERAAIDDLWNALNDNEPEPGNHDTLSDKITLPGIECFEDDGPSDRTATVRFENGVRLRYRFTDNGRAYEEVFPADEFQSENPTPSTHRDWTGIHETRSTTNAAEELVEILIEYEAYRDGEGYKQLRSDWGRNGIADAIAGVAGDGIQ